MSLSSFGDDGLPSKSYTEEIPIEELIANHDWASTSLGPMESWDSSLKSTVSICLHSVFPMAIYYGEDWVFIYNQMWRPILKMKHPSALGKTFKEVWPEVYDKFMKLFNEIKVSGKGTYEDDTKLFLHRAGYNEETYFSFTLSPIFKNNAVTGILAAVQETTEKVLSARRLKTLSELGNSTSGAGSVENACHILTSTIRKYNTDIPYLLVYLVDNKNKNSTRSANLIATTFDEDLEIDSNGNGSRKSKRSFPDYFPITYDYLDLTMDENYHNNNNHNDNNHNHNHYNNNNNNNSNIVNPYSISSSPSSSDSSTTPFIPKISEEILSKYGHPLDLSNTTSSTWPLKKILKSNINEDTETLVELKDGTYAMIFPVFTNLGGKAVLTSIMICGIDECRTIDKKYMNFLKLVVNHTTSALTYGMSREEEKRQATVLADLNRQKIMFFQNISHELRTPLTLMLSPLDEAVTICKQLKSISADDDNDNNNNNNNNNNKIINKKNTSVECDTLLTHLNMAQRNSRRLLKLVNSLLQFSRIEAGKLEAIYRETDISKLTIELASCFESMAHSLDLQYNVEILKPEIFNKNLKKKIYLDKDMYEKIVFNICSNAFKHTWKGSVTLRLYIDKKNDKEIVVFEVSDTGVGIPEKDIPNLFQRFYRVESKQSRSYEGTGIGLALVRELINRHGGEVSVESKVDVGTTFKIWIPTGFEHLPSNRVIVGASPSDKDIRMLNDVENDRNDKNENSFYKFNRELYLEESFQWIQKNKPDFNDEPKFNDSDDEAEPDDNRIKFDDDFDAINNNDHNNDDHKNDDHTNDNHKNDDHTNDDHTNDDHKNDESNSQLQRPKKLKPRILIVDDNTDMRAYLAGVLCKDFKVFSASDGKDALTVVNGLKKLPDLILSDIMMPNMDGFELLNALRSDSTTQSIPVILLSAKAGEEASVTGLNHGADDYLTKPFHPKELIARVRTNIKLSKLRQKLYNQQRQQIITKELLFTISREIHSEHNLQVTLANLIKEIYKIFDCERILIYANKIDNNADEGIFNVETTEYVILAHCSKDENERSFVGETIDYLEEQHKVQTDPKLLDGLITETGIEDCSNNVADNYKNDNNDHDAEDLMVLFEMPNFYFELLKTRVSLFCILIIVNKKNWGWLSFHRPAYKNFNKSEKIFLQQIANQMSLAITHSKLLEEKLKREAQVEAAKVANEAKNQILANTSHELRTPLGAMIGVLSAFEETPLTYEQKDMVQIMTRASDVVLSVINDILDAAKLGAKKISLINKPFNLFDLMERTVEMFGERAGNKEIELILDYGKFDIAKIIKSDPERLRQILMNLLLNAIKFTEEGEITVEVSMLREENVEDINKLKNIDDYYEIKKIKKDVLLFKVSDTGMGIEEEYLENIFESFIQCDASMTRKQDGIGLGLAICKHLVTINGGKLGVKSEFGKGSTFWFTWIIESLPSSSVPITPETSSPLPLLSSLTTTAYNDEKLLSSLRSKKVLIIDHNPKSRNRSIKIIGEIAEKVHAFDIIEKGIEVSKKWRQSCNKPLYDMVFINIKEKTYKEQEKLLNELSSLNQQYNIDDDNGDNQFCIAIMYFWSINGRIISKNMMSNINGKVVGLCKPIMKKKFLDCLRNSKLFKTSSSHNNDDDKMLLESSNNGMDYYHERSFLSSSAIISNESIEADKFENLKQHLNQFNNNIDDNMIIDNNEKEGNINVSKDIHKLINVGGGLTISHIDGDSISEKDDKKVVEGNIKTARNNNKGQKEQEKKSKIKNTKIKNGNGNTNDSLKRKLSINDNEKCSAKSRSRVITKTKCVLCVEDNPINLKVIQHQLKVLGYPSLSATNGQEAIDAVKSEFLKDCSSSNGEDNTATDSKISLILMDCAMPVMSGFDASKAIRLLNSPASNVPIIALTASAADGTKDKCLESGMNDYVTKPLKLNQLKDVLNQWLNQEDQ